MAGIKELEQVLVNKMHMHPAGIEQGRVVDLYHYHFDKPVKLSTVQRAAGRFGYLAAPWDGFDDHFIVVAVPRKKRAVVSLKTIMDHWVFKQSRETLPIILGEYPLESPAIVDLNEISNLMIAGDAGTGKSELLKSIIASLVAHNTPDKLKLMILDTTGAGLIRKKYKPYLSQPTIPHDAAEAVALLKHVVNKINHRYACGDDFGHLVVIIDELADLVSVAKKQVTEMIQQITQYGPAVGVHLVAATNRPSAKFIPRLVMANFPTRVVFHLDAAATSRALLGDASATRLLKYGDALYTVNGRAPVRIHTPKFDIK